MGFISSVQIQFLNAVYIVGGAAAAYRRNVIVGLGGFDECIITEDIEMSTRIQDHGYRIQYAADAIVYTEGPSDFKGLCRQRVRWKFGRLLTFCKYRHMFFSLTQRTIDIYVLLFFPSHCLPRSSSSSSGPPHRVLRIHILFERFCAVGICHTPAHVYHLSSDRHRWQRTVPPKSVSTCSHCVAIIYFIELVNIKPW
jgi:hypothetical protein